LPVPGVAVRFPASTAPFHVEADRFLCVDACFPVQPAPGRIWEQNRCFQPACLLPVGLPVSSNPTVTETASFVQRSLKRLISVVPQRGKQIHSENAPNGRCITAAGAQALLAQNMSHANDSKQDFRNVPLSRCLTP